MIVVHSDRVTRVLVRNPHYPRQLQSGEAVGVGLDGTVFCWMDVGLEVDVPVGWVHKWWIERGVMMDKNSLNDYIDACALIKETEVNIKKIKHKRTIIVTDSVKGSMSEFPYAAQNFRIQGVSHTAINHLEELARQEQMLEERKAIAQAVKTQIEEWLNTIPLRMQRIIGMKVFDKESWEDVAKKMGRKATADSVKKEFQRFLCDK